MANSIDPSVTAPYGHPFSRGISVMMLRFYGTLVVVDLYQHNTASSGCYDNHLISTIFV